MLEYLENLKDSLSSKPSADIQYAEDMTASLVKLKSKVIIRAVESIVKRIQLMSQDKMNGFDLVSKSFTEYLGRRVPMLECLADLAVLKSSKSVN